MFDHQPIDSTFAALADPTRCRMIERLLLGDATISELAAPHDMSMPAAMKHVARLVEAGLVRRRKHGRTVTCSLNIGPLDAAQAWLREHLDFWSQRLDALNFHLARQKKTAR